MYTKKDTERAINVALNDKLTCSLYLMSNYPKTFEFTLLEGVEEGSGNQATVSSYQLPALGGAQATRCSRYYAHLLAPNLRASESLIF